VRLAQHIAAAPHGFDEIAAFGGVGELLAELADEDVDDLQFGLIHAAIEMVEPTSCFCNAVTKWESVEIVAT
jgi:hypothetical protein